MTTDWDNERAAEHAPANEADDIDNEFRATQPFTVSDLANPDSPVSQEIKRYVYRQVLTTVGKIVREAVQESLQNLTPEIERQLRKTMATQIPDLTRELSQQLRDQLIDEQHEREEQEDKNNPPTLTERVVNSQHGQDV